MGARGRGRGKGKAQNVALKKTPPGARKRGKAAVKEEVEDEPPAKLQREESLNTKLRKAIKETKDNSPKKKVFKPDRELSNYTKGEALKICDDYSCMLNQTNIGHNNNKYYVIQLVTYGGSYGCFTKWGRVGEAGQHLCDHFDDKEKAIAAFKAKFKSKTKNDWDKRSNFTAYSGKYTLLEIDEESESEDETDNMPLVKKEITSSQHVKCSLDDRTALLIKLIFNDDMFVNQMAHMNLDVKKMPLGKLSKSQLAKGLEVLLDLEKALQSKTNRNKLSELSSSFYTLIPHNFGRKVPTVIDDQSIIDQKKELMMTLSDIELTLSLQKEKGDESKVHPLDDKYNKLNCRLDLMDKKSEEYKMIVKYAKACPNTRKGPILDIWKVDRSSEGTRFDVHKDIKHRKLLWHGTNVAVVAAIMNSGLRIMPHSGGRVGRGIYFASEHSKSAWYVGINYGSFENESNIGFMFLVEVVLGKEHNITSDDHTLKAAPKGFDSVVARGTTEPDQKQNAKVKLEGKDVIVPLGKPIKSEYEVSNFSQSEYLVYKESQARIRYLLKLSFV